MANTLFSFIIKESKNTDFIESVLNQQTDDWECFIIGNQHPKIQQIVDSDSRFHIIPETGNRTDDITTAIQQVSGKYVILLNSKDYFIPSALFFINQMIESTDANIIVYSTLFVETRPELKPVKQRCSFRYTVRREKIMKNMFDSLSEFCFKREFLQSITYCKPEELFIFNILANTDAIVKTGLICILEKTRNLDIATVEYKYLIDNFQEKEKSFDKNFWKLYFSQLIPRIMDSCVYQHDKNSLKYCAKKIPAKYIPLKYKFMFWLLRNINI